MTVTYHPNGLVEVVHEQTKRFVREDQIASLAQTDGDFYHLLRKAKLNPGSPVVVDNEYRGRKPRNSVQYAIAM